MIFAIATLNKKQISFFVIMIVGLSTIPIMTSTAYSQTTNLFVSAENPLFDNGFTGPMVIEVVINDPDISDIVNPQSEPDVTVNGKELRMVQATDGNWYGYFADIDMAQIADSTVGLPGFGLDYGEFCQNISHIAGIGLLDTEGFAIARDIATGSNGLEPLSACIQDDVLPTDPLVNHVLRETKQINLQSPLPGQIGIDEDVWPLIQLFDFTPSGNVQVQYNKGGGPQTIILEFLDDGGKYADISLVQTTHFPDSDIMFTLTDLQLNIDPTDEDSWTFGTNSTNIITMYQVFDENGAQDADGTSGAVNIVSVLNKLGFDENGVLIIDPNPNLAAFNVVNLQDNDYQAIITGPSIGDAVSVGGSFGIGTQPLTVTEIQSNSGLFTNTDQQNVANLVTTPDAIPGTTATIDYNDSPTSILIIAPPTFCFDMTIEELLSSGIYPSSNIFDNRDGSLGTNFVGTNGDDLMIASEVGNNIHGKKGNDCIIGGDGGDKLFGGNGADIIFGQDGDDKVMGQNGNDALSCGTGTDFAHGGPGTDTASRDCETKISIP